LSLDVQLLKKKQEREKGLDVMTVSLASAAMGRSSDPEGNMTIAKRNRIAKKSRRLPYRELAYEEFTEKA
jgi:hypothetical protein